MKKAIITLLAIFSLHAVASESCNTNAIDAEMNEMKASPYWNKQFQDFAKEMNRIRPRGCSFAETQETGLAIFMDDLEFTGSYGEDRVLATSGHYQTEHGSYNSKNEFYVSSVNVDFYQPQVSEIRVYLQQGTMALLTKTCSPKAALANLIAYSPYALIAHCGENRQTSPEVAQAIQTKVQEILDGEK
jgi:hypothetical protein